VDLVRFAKNNGIKVNSRKKVDFVKKIWKWLETEKEQLEEIPEESTEDSDKERKKMGTKEKKEKKKLLNERKRLMKKTAKKEREQVVRNCQKVQKNKSKSPNNPFTYP